MDAKPTISYDDFAKLDLRVATVTACEPHPNADRLLKMQIDLGEMGPRQILAGIRQFEQPEDLIGKQIVVVANLEPRNIRGEQSNGMLMAATVGEGNEMTDVVILTPTRTVSNGSAVS